MYYLLFTSQNGQYVTDAEMGLIMDEFINLLNLGATLTTTPSSASLNPNDSVTVTVNYDVSGLLQGTYEGSARVDVGNPYNVFLNVPAIITVTGTAILGCFRFMSGLW